MFAFILIFPILFFSSNAEFFDQVAKEKAMGAEWHHVGPQGLDPTAKSIPAQVCDPETNVCDEPYIIWKLKMPEDVVNETRE